MADAIPTCGPIPNVMAALPNIGGVICSTPQSLADAHYQSGRQRRSSGGEGSGLECEEFERLERGGAPTIFGRAAITLGIGPHF